MQFLYPAVLWFLFALSIPVIIHLFSFRRAKRLNFSSLKNLRLVKNHSDTKNNLKRYLILLSRILFLLLLILCFAGPYIPSETDRRKSESVVIFVDNSPSMTIESDDGIPLIDRAVGLGNQIVQKYDPNTEFYIITSDQPFNRYNNLGKEAALKFLSSIQVSGKTVKISSLLISLEDPEVKDSDIYLISDFQNQFLDTQAGIDNQNFIFMPLKYGPVANISIDSLYLNEPVGGIADEIKMNVDITNYGNESKENIPVRVELNGSQVGVTEVNLNAKATETITFDIKTKLQDINKGRVVVEDLPVSFDNEFFWSLNKLSTVSVSVISEKNKSVFDALFADNQLFNYNYFSFGNIDYQNINYADLLIINGVTEISTSLLSSIRSRLSDGGSVLIVGGYIQGASSQVRQFLSQYGFKQVNINEKVSVEKKSFTNPFMEGVFENIPDNLDVPWVKPKLRWRAAEPIITLNNGMTLFGRAELQKPIYFLSSSLVDSVTNIHNHGLFLPLLYKTAFYSSNTIQNLYYKIEATDEGITFDWQSEKDDILKLSNGENVIIPEVRYSANSASIFLPLEAEINPGHYEVVSGTELIRILALNLGGEESNLEQITSDSLKVIYPDHEVLTNPDVSEVRATIDRMDYGQDIWQWFLIGSLIFLLIEIILIRMI
ncbi:BatA domain-containing protein [Mangrovivirga sp. M17]|uniref:BatA domain-containing protein n=1 Tax=Mangrovivirga halotolerans TaxID=2993936 RepID=A0ABT3RWR2_9BACT|nr:BatA domain-containing protein [Mangrovivirga halotolerans]MCX2745971.1 BatA domain-containing protein [Mangrovivirga halotolerans]